MHRRESEDNILHLKSKNNNSISFNNNIINLFKSLDSENCVQFEPIYISLKIE